MIRVDNLDNLFWDNGSWQYPNTYPHLVGGKWLENITPVMTSPVTGWVILEGEYNYCQYNDELFFLKKDKRISVSKNKWRYILIKDHLCTIFKNKANIIAKGTLVNTNLETLKDDEFQFTFPVFTNFNKRILLPLKEETYHWKKHLIPTKPNKTFESWDTVGNKEFTQFITTLIQNRDQLGQKKTLEQLLKGNKYCTLLGRANKSRREKNWKNELIEKINRFLDEIRTNDEIIFGNIDESAHSWIQLQGKYAITYSSYSLVRREETNKQISEVDLSGLIDIELVSLSTTRAEPSRVYFPIKLKYQDTLLVDDSDWSPETAKYIKKLSRRVRLPFVNPFTSRAIMFSQQKFSTWYWNKRNKELFYPQKIYFRVEAPLEPQDKYSREFPQQRRKESYRSVYLYYCYNLDFVFLFSDTLKNKNARLAGDYVLEKDFIDPATFFKGTEDIRVSLSNNLTFSDDWNAVQIIEKDYYETYYPWAEGQALYTKEHLNIGWLVGQFSQHISSNSAYFEDDYPFIIKAGTSQLKRIEGLNPTLVTLTQNKEAYKTPDRNSHLGTYDESHIWDLDIFNTLPLRARKNTLEADFLIGEKMLFTTWGMAPYLLFQPASLYQGYAYYWYNNLDTSPNSKLIGNWLYWAGTTQGWYPYQVFDIGDDYIQEKTKNWFKKAYEAYAPLEYKRFYADLDNFRQLKLHIQKNTDIYFTTKPRTFGNTPIKELKKGDIFFSNLEWFWFDQSEASTLLTHNKNDFLIHDEDKGVNLENGDIVVYCTPQDNLLHIGKVSIWDSEFKLPDNQYIVQGGQINDPSPNTQEDDKMRVKYTKIRELEKFESFDTLIESLKQKSEIFFSGIADFNFEDLNNEVQATYLFDLVGTGFYCLYYGLKDQVHLIFKEEEERKCVGEITQKLYSIGTDEEVTNLTRTQWVNQQLKLSMYGQKLDLPVKAFKDEIVANIKVNTAHVKGGISEHTESHKVEIKHKLGYAYFRFDIPKLITTSQITNTDAFAFEDLNMRNKRALEDYLIHRRQFNLDTERMNLAHTSQRLEHKWALANSWTNTVTGAIGGITGGLGTGLAVAGKLAAATTPLGAGALVVGGIGYGISKLIGMGRGVANVSWHLQEKGRIMEEQIDIGIREKAMQSYTLDLNFERQKEDHLFNLRRLFSQVSFNSSSSRDRNKLLDGMEDKKPAGEIYLELWTTSPEQDEYVKDYHNKHGVDCRVPQWMMSIKNGIQVGIYTMEDVQISNLQDRIDYLFLKGRLENGIKFIEWKEHEKVEELIPVDPRITKLQRALELAEKHQIQLEQDKLIQSQKIQELLGKAAIEQDKYDQMVSDLDSKSKALIEAQKDIQGRDQHIENEAKKYHELANSYHEQEKELREARNVQNLYREQTTQLKKSAEATKLQLDEQTKRADEKTRENESLTQQVENQLQQIQQLTREKDETQQQLVGIRQEKEEQQTKIQQLEQEVQSNKDKEQRIQQLTTENERLQTELRERPKGPEETLYADIWKKSLFRKIHVEQDYLVVSCDANYDIVKFDESVYAWVKTDEVTLKAFDQYKLVRPIFDPKKVPMRAKKYNNNLGSGEAQFKRVLKTKADLNNAFFVPDSKKKVYDWSTTVRIANEFNEPFPYFKTKPTGAEDTLACQFNSITNYGEYLEALGMELVEGQVVTKQGENIKALNERITALEKERDELKHESQENHASMTALHQLIVNKDQKIHELEAKQGTPYLEWLGTIIGPKNLLVLTGDPEYYIQKERVETERRTSVKFLIPRAIFIIKKRDDDDYEIIDFSSKLKAFTQTYSYAEGVRLRVWRYPAYELFTLGGENGSKMWRVKQSVWDGWISYFNEPQTTYQQLIDRKIIGSGNITGFPIFFPDTGECAIPYFKVTQYTLRSGEGAGSKIYISLENGPIFWNAGERVFSYSATGKTGIKLKQINNYKEYRELFGIVLEYSRSDKRVDFETQEEFQHWWETEGEGADRLDITRKY